MTDLIEIRVLKGRDREPLQLVSGEQVRYWLDLERLAREFLSQRQDAQLQGLLNELAFLLGFPSQE